MPIEALLPPVRPPLDNRILTFDWTLDDLTPCSAQVSVYRDAKDPTKFDLHQIITYVVGGEDLVPIQHAVLDPDWYALVVLLNGDGKPQVERAFARDIAVIDEFEIPGRGTVLKVEDPKEGELPFAKGQFVRGDGLLWEIRGVERVLRPFNLTTNSHAGLLVRRVLEERGE